jgi:hypothetical protein
MEESAGFNFHPADVATRIASHIEARAISPRGL